METTQQYIHPFEAAGLGVAPFHFVGMTEKSGPIKLGNGLTVGAPGQPMGTCDYCGQGIKYCCSIKAADGAEFIVGNDCVRKTYKKGSRVLTDVQRAVNARKTEIRNAKLAKRRIVAVELFEQHRAAIAELPHSNRYWADQGRTRADEVQWMIERAGNQRAVSEVNQAIKAAGIAAKA